MLRIASLLCPVVLIFTAFASEQTPSSNSASSSAVPKLDRSTIAALQLRVPELLRDAGIPGASVALVRDGKVYWSQGFGVRDAKAGKPVTNDTIFEAASLSKPVFSYAVLKLVDEGKLDLDRPLGQYLKKPYIEDDPRVNAITARFVLSHRTGFPNWRQGGYLKIGFTPGERFSYSGEGFVYLGKVITHITGRSLNDFLSEEVFVPLGMSNSSFIWRDDYDPRTAEGHGSAGDVQEKWKPTAENPASSLQTTAGDYALFLAALLRGNGLKPETLKQMEAEQVAVDPDCTNCLDHPAKALSKTLFWGLGIGIQQTAQGESLWHWGDNGAFKCFMLAYPKQKSALVFFTNSENGLSIAPEMVRLVFGGEQPAFAWIKYDRYDSVAMQFAKAVNDKGAAQAIEEFRATLKSGDLSEKSINTIGYQLLGRKEYSEAVAIFQLNVELFPQSSNVYDSLAEAYFASGDKALAQRNYQKSLDLDPKNTNAAAMLKKINP